MANLNLRGIDDKFYRKYKAMCGDMGRGIAEMTLLLMQREVEAYEEQKSEEGISMEEFGEETLLEHISQFVLDLSRGDSIQGNSN